MGRAQAGNSGRSTHPWRHRHSRIHCGHWTLSRRDSARTRYSAHHGASNHRGETGLRHFSVLAAAISRMLLFVALPSRRLSWGRLASNSEGEDALGTAGRMPALQIGLHLFVLLIKRAKRLPFFAKFWIELKCLLVSDPGFRNAVGLLQDLTQPQVPFGRRGLGHISHGIGE